MFKLSNGKEFSRLVITCFDTTLGYITKSPLDGILLI